MYFLLFIYLFYPDYVIVFIWYFIFFLLYNILIVFNLRCAFFYLIKDFHFHIFTFLIAFQNLAASFFFFFYSFGGIIFVSYLFIGFNLVIGSFAIRVKQNIFSLFALQFFIIIINYFILRGFIHIVSFLLTQYFRWVAVVIWEIVWWAYHIIKPLIFFWIL